MTSHDAVVIGAGPNGLVAANRLVDAGWDVLLLEAQPTAGGAVRSDRDVHPAYVHDTFSSFYPLAHTSPAIRSLGLEDHGLRWTHAPAVLGHPRLDGSWAMLHRDVDVTAELLDGEHPGDGDAWRRLYDAWTRLDPMFMDALLSPMPPVRAGLGVLTRLRKAGGMAFIRMLLEPSNTLGEQHFGGDGGRLLLAGNAAHTDIPLDAAGSGLMAVVLAMMGQHVGFPVPVGGAGELSAALVRRFTSRGGVLRTSSPVDAVLVRDARAVGVRTNDEEIGARRAVIADVAAERLFGGLVSFDDLPARTKTGMRRFERDPATIKVDWALSGPVPWTGTPPYGPGTVHLAASVEAATRSVGQVAAHQVPAEPFLLMGQMTTTDATRSPEGTESVWAYSHVPQEVRSDAGDAGLTGAWDHDECERFADRMQTQLERYAPDVASRIVTRRVLGPREFEARDANLIGGSINGGTSALHQQLVFRPVPGLGRASTPIRHLYLGSAAAHPGGGVHGACGLNAARAALADARLDSLRFWARP